MIKNMFKTKVSVRFSEYESLGKKDKGFLPLISNVPKDHHSLLQLYLDGQKDKLFIFLSFEDKTKHKISVKKFIDKKHFLEGKNIDLVCITKKIVDRTDWYNWFNKKTNKFS